MPKVYKAKNVLHFFEKEWFQKVSQKWSHIKLKNPSWTIIIIPIHTKDIPYWTFRAIIDQSWLDNEYVVKSLGK